MAVETTEKTETAKTEATTETAKTDTTAAKTETTETAKTDTTKTETKVDAGAAKSLLSEIEEQPVLDKDGNPVVQPKGGPESYTDFTLPEGLAPDAKLMDAFKATAKELGLSQENAQKLVSLQAEHAKAGMEALVKGAEEQRTQMIAKFKTDTIAALSANGQDWKKEMGFAARALGRFGTPELRKLLDETGFSNHSELVSAWIKVGKEMAEDGHLRGSAAPHEDAEEAGLRAQFPTMFGADGTRKPEFKKR